MTNELVSVIVPTHNRADCLARTLDSVFSQTYEAIEIILIDDGSTDQTREFVQQRWSGNERLRYLYQPNRGVSAARNLGLRKARGEYIAFLDSDDAWMPWKLDAQLACLRAFPDAGMVWTDMQAFDLDGRLISAMYLREMYDAYQWFTPEQLFSVACPLASVMRPVPEALRTSVMRYGQIFSPMVMGNLVHTSTVLLRRARFEQVRCFDEGMRTGEDYDFHLRTCRSGPVVLLDAAAIRYQCGRSDRLTRPELSIEIGRNFLRTVERVIQRDRALISLPDWMIDRSLASGHEWVGEAALSSGEHAEAKRHLWAALRLRPSARTALLFAGALLPSPATRALRGGLRRIKNAARSAAE